MASPVIALRLDPELKARALAHAKALDCTFSDLLRVALEQFLTTLPPLPVMPDDELPPSVS